VTVRTFLVRLGAAVAFWAGSILFCFLYSYVHPSSLAYVGLALIVGWYFYIPVLVVIVSVIWFLAGRSKRICQL
jgi:hypothetical protein